MPFRYCPQCGAELVSRVVKAGEPERRVCLACEYIQFEQPKLAAGCIVEVDGGIALVRRSIEPGYGKWVFPGGYVDRGERVEDAARRETLEESCLEVRITGLLNIYSYPGRPVAVVVFTAEVLGGVFAAADEALECGTFTPSEVPWSELAFPSTFDALSEYVARVHGFDAPTDSRPPHPG